MGCYPPSNWRILPTYVGAISFLATPAGSISSAGLQGQHQEQAKAEEGFDVANFRIDWEGKIVTCPRERQSTSVGLKPRPLGDEV